MRIISKHFGSIPTGGNYCATSILPLSTFYGNHNFPGNVNKAILSPPLFCLIDEAPYLSDCNIILIFFNCIYFRRNWERINSTFSDCSVNLIKCLLAGQSPQPPSKPLFVCLMEGRFLKGIQGIRMFTGQMVYILSSSMHNW